MPDAPQFENLSLLNQILVLIGGAIAGAFSWFFGGLKNSPSTSATTKGTEIAQASLIELENEKLRNDLENVLLRHREAIDNKMNQMSDGMRAVIERQSERLRSVEIAIARLEESIKHGSGRRGST